MALHRQIDDLKRAAANIMAQLEAFTPTGDAEIDRQWRGQLQRRFAEVANETRTKSAELGKISGQQQLPRLLNPALLERVPVIEFDLLDLPEEQQRRLFDAFHLELRYHRHLHQLTAKVTVYAETVDALRRAIPGPDDLRGQPHGAVPRIAHIPAQRGMVPGADAPGTGSHVLRAPGRSRRRSASSAWPPSDVDVCRVAKRVQNALNRAGLDDGQNQYPLRGRVVLRTSERAGRYCSWASPGLGWRAS